jgi:hypothetical protein
MPSPYKSRKYITAVGSLMAVFLLEAIHPGSAKNLEIVVPAILASYHGSNVLAAKFGNERHDV